MYLKLEWVYEKDMAAQENEVCQSVIFPPPHDETQKLFDMVQKGDIIGIRKQAEKLKAPGSEYIYFGEKLYRLSKNLLIDEVRQFISLYRQ